MKKFYRNSASLLGVVFLAALCGCQDSPDEELSPYLQETVPVQLVDGTLKFATAKDYEDVYEDFKSFAVPEFISMKVHHNSNWSASSNLRVSEEGQTFLEDLDDAIILELLDKDGMVIIKDYLIFLDFENLVAAVTEDHSLREELLNRNYDDDRISVFSFKDDVLEIISEGPDFMEEKSEGTKENLRVLSMCPGIYPPGSTTPPLVGVVIDGRKCEYSSTWINRTTGWAYRATAVHVYQPAAIYFRLKSEIAHHKMPPTSGTDWSAEASDMNVTYWGSFTPRNRSTVHLSACWDQCQGCWPQPANRQKVQKVHHEAARRLTQYNLFGIYQVKIGGEHSSAGGTRLAFRLRNIQRN